MSDLDDPTFSSSKKRIEVDGVFFRYRRGKLVQIPDQWVDKTLTPQTKRKRLSKLTNKQARTQKTTAKGPKYNSEKYQTKGGLSYIDGRHKHISDDL